MASRRARSREPRAAESSEQRDVRLERHRERDGVARATSRCREESDVHIQRVRVDQQRRLASESADGRESRLQYMRVNQQRRLASESQVRERLVSSK